MTDADKIKWCWNRAGAWDFEKEGILRMAAPIQTPAGPSGNQGNTTSPVRDTIVEFRIAHGAQDGRPVTRVLGKFRDTEIPVTDWFDK